MGSYLEGRQTMNTALRQTMQLLGARTGLRTFSMQGRSMPDNVAELGEAHLFRIDQVLSQGRDFASHEASVSQAARVFGSGFLSDQTTVSDVADDELNELGAMVGEDQKSHLEFYTELFLQSILSMDVKTNVPEPFSAEDMSEDDLKEGLPAGLSDSQVSLEARTNMEYRLEASNTDMSCCI